METLALVPARGGSKGIPRKNLVALAGRPLLAWTLDAAQASETVERIVVSTDSDEIAALARELGAEVLGRPPKLAMDDTPMLDVVRHAFAELGSPDVLVLLQPTSPLRRAEHIDAAVRLLLKTGADKVLSVVEVPHQFSPGSLMELRDGRLEPIASAGAARRQDKTVVYARNGPAVLVLRPERLGDDLYGGDCRPYLMDLRDSIDVDGPLELELAEALLRQSPPA